ncbi:Shedu anti-phage system protein SduA domain-containing protein [Klebsiella pneumoniae]
MDLDKLIRKCSKRLERHFNEVHKLELSGRLASSSGVPNCAHYYPTTLIGIKTENSYCIELAGVSSKPCKLQIKIKEGMSLERFLSFYDKDPNDKAKFHPEGDSILRKSSCRNFLITDFPDDINVGVDRFPIMRTIYTILEFPSDKKRTIDITEGFMSFSFSNVCICSLVNDFFRVRSIMGMFIFGLNISSRDLSEEMNFYLDYVTHGDVFGVISVPPGQSEKYMEVAYLMNLVLNGGVNETWIGDFFNSHKHILTKALGYQDFIYEPYMEWIEKSDDNQDTAINPDVMLMKADGFYDICDFKKGLTNKNKITRRERNRRTFISDIYEGIAQLNNYEEYFSYEGNRRRAKERYNISVNDPLKILIVGNVENTVNIEVEQALRGMVNMRLIDYDSLINLYVHSVIK